MMPPVLEANGGTSSSSSGAARRAFATYRYHVADALVGNSPRGRQSKILVVGASIWLVVVAILLLGIFSSYVDERPFGVNLKVDQNIYRFGSPILVSWTFTSPRKKTIQPEDWIGIWPAHKFPQPDYTSASTPTIMWQYVDSSTSPAGFGASAAMRGKKNNLGGEATSPHMAALHAAAAAAHASAQWKNMQGDNNQVLFGLHTHWETEYIGYYWPLCNGKWVACFIRHEQSMGCTEEFQIQHGNCQGLCKPALSDPFPETHLFPKPNYGNKQSVTRIAFGSDFDVTQQTTNTLWNHFRFTFQPHVWIWLGNVMYGDGHDMELKRSMYNHVKRDQHYRTMGPLGRPQIPVLSTWDAHDGGVDRMGALYSCYNESQREFVNFYSIPETDPRHYNYNVSNVVNNNNDSPPPPPRTGVYSSISFPKHTKTPAGPTLEPGIHVILLDVRTFRSPIFTREGGKCMGSESTMLGQKQWTWLEKELKDNAHVPLLIIGSALPILQPTDQIKTPIKSYCAYDNDNSFRQAIQDIGEDANWQGTSFEGWGQIPQERTKLLKLLQRNMNDPSKQRVVLLSGSMQWGELQAKQMPSYTDSDGNPQEETTIFEITSSGIDRSWQRGAPNANRLRVRSCDSRGNGLYHNECNLPFTFNNVLYDDCTSAPMRHRSFDNTTWCPYKTSNHPNHTYVDGLAQWGICRKQEDELLPRANISYVEANHACNDDNLMICNAQANYGGIEVNWENNTVTLSIFTPHRNDNPNAAVITLGL